MKKQSIILCSKCLKEKKYIMPRYSINMEKNDIEYICKNHDILSESDLYDIQLTDKIKNLLSKCNLHNDTNFCAWCEKCSKNICPICIGEELKKNHNYIFYDSLMTENDNYIFYKTKISFMTSFLEEIKKYYVDVKNYKKEIILLEKIIECNQNCSNLFFSFNIINYQVIINMKANMNVLLENYEKYESMSNKKYSVFLSFIKGKEINDINQKKIDINFSNFTSNILLFNSELYDEENDENITDYHNNVIIFISEDLKENRFNQKERSLKIYDLNGNLLNKINVTNLGYEKILQYKSNILLVFYKEYIQAFISFYIFSSDFKNYAHVEEIYLNSLIGLNITNYYHSYISLCSFSSEDNIVKIDKNKILLFYSYRVYFIEINDDLIFKNKQYYKSKNQNEIKLDKNLEIIQDFTHNYYLKVIPIYSRDVNNKGISNFLKLKFKAELSRKDELKLKHTVDAKKIIYEKNLAHFNSNDNVNDFECKDKYNIKLKYFKTNDYSLDQFQFFKKYFYDNKQAWNIIKRIKIYGELIKVDNDEYSQRYSRNFIISPKDVETLLKNEAHHFDLDYCYSTNYILFLLNNTIYQINYNTLESIIIYELDFSFNKENILSQYYLVNIIHYYQKDLQKIVELILFKNTGKNQVFPYYFDCHELKSIKPFTFPNFMKITELNFFESSNNVMKNSLDFERLLVDSDELIIFK